MKDFRKVFTKRHSLLVVIHVVNKIQVLDNIHIAMAAGAEGVFLINHETSANHLLALYGQARRQFPSYWIGLNFLDRSPLGAMEMLPESANGLWVDDGGVEEGVNNPTQRAAIFLEARQKKLGLGSWLYFGGVAFKGQQPVRDVGKVAKLAVPFMDVITTSGEATGYPPPPKKIKAIRVAIGPGPLVAIASGISGQNIRQYPEADIFMAASALTGKGERLCPEKVSGIVKQKDEMNA